MDIAFRVLIPEEKTAVEDFETSLSDGAPLFRAWTAPWRSESLDYYLRTGWCFGAWQGDVLVGYFLAQPLLFVREMTQTLWVECVRGRTPEITQALGDLAHRYGRDKHLQVVLFWNGANSPGSLPGEYLKQEVFETRTAKF